YESREVCIGSGKIRNKADIHNIARRADQNRNRRGGALGGECSRAAPGDQDVHRHRHELSSKFGKTIITAFGVSVRDDDVFALDPPHAETAPASAARNSRRFMRALHTQRGYRRIRMSDNLTTRPLPRPRFAVTPNSVADANAIWLFVAVRLEESF